MTKILVEMDKFALITNPDDQLITEGISTCIAFVVNGVYLNKDNKPLNFAALYHWSGFGEEEIDPNGHTKELLKRFFNTIRSVLQLESRQPITLTNLHFIGGEKAQYNKSGEVELSGTEKEVEALIHTVKHFGFNKRRFILAQGAIQHSHFLTENEDLIDITVQLNQCEFKLEQHRDMEEGEEQYSSMRPK